MDEECNFHMISGTRRWRK